ncbi:hypothetical protein [Bradyrhizobium prioriisuperbiae]|uniref:hypothetical protein n=1 Tax=Bradyrhizobium prioriisuperbiae TaxID=2854389 RepID=UPI0028EBF618|nr:hypothetical protein [Bradyrhizobium prioritasuperba]
MPDPIIDLIELPDKALHNAIAQMALELGGHHTASPAQRERLDALEGERNRRRRAAMEHVLFNGGFADTGPEPRTRERPDDHDGDDDYEFVPAHEESGPGGRMDYIYAHWRRKRRRRARAPDMPDDRIALSPDDTPSPAPSDGDFDPRDGLREKRLMHLHMLARERGLSYTPHGDVADNDVYVEEMARLGYSPDDDENSLSGWIDTPEQSDWDALDTMLDEMGPIDRIYLAFDQLISSGELGQDFWDALPDPHAFVLGLFAIVVLQFVPGIDILLDAYLLYTLGKQFFELLDALSALNTAGNAREFARAREAFGRAVASISIDGIIAAATWGLKKLGSVPKGRGPRVQPRPRPRPQPRVQRIQPRPQLKPRLPKGLEEIPPDRAIQINGGAGGRSFGPGGYSPPRRWKPFEAPKPPGPGYYGEPLERFLEGTRPEPRRDIGRTGRDTRIVELADDPSVPSWIREHIRRQIRENPTGDYRLPKKGDIGPDGRPLKEDYVLGHEEHTRDPFTGRITKEGRPARENNPYGGTRPISEGLNKFEEAMRRRLEVRYAAHLETLFNRLRRLKAQKRWSEVRRLLREMISKGDVKFENLPAELQDLMRG